MNYRDHDALDTQQQAAFGQQGAEIEIDTLSGISSQTADTLAEAIKIASSISDRISGPRPEAVSALREPPHPGSAIYSAKTLRDGAQEVLSLLHRIHSVL